jgi:hypothetical protein
VQAQVSIYGLPLPNSSLADKWGEGVRVDLRKKWRCCSRTTLPLGKGLGKVSVLAHLLSSRTVF